MSVIDVFKQNLKNVTIFLQELKMSYNLTMYMFIVPTQDIT